MKKLLIFPMLLCLINITSCDNSPKINIPNSNRVYENIIGTPIKIDNLEVAQYNFPESMNWYDAQEVCAKLGNSWRLPTKDELNVMYQNKDKIGGFAYYLYWSSTETSDYDARRLNFDNGVHSYGNKNYLNHVRAVRAF